MSNKRRAPRRKAKAKAKAPATKRSEKIPLPPVVDLTQFDVIVVSTSAGKDSLVALWIVCSMAKRQGVLDRVHAIHCDLGRVEHDGVVELAKRQCAAQGVPLTVVTRIGQVATKDSSVYAKGEVYGDLWDYVLRRGAWHSESCRFCTSEFKRSPSEKHYTACAAKWRAMTGEKRAARILDVQGIRAEEAPDTRGARPEHFIRKENRNQFVSTWYRVHKWTEKQVWACIRENELEYHPVYDQGMPRLSCVFCHYAKNNPDALRLAGKLYPEKLDAACEVEETLEARKAAAKTQEEADAILPNFTKNLSLREIREDVKAGKVPEKVSDWEMPY